MKEHNIFLITLKEDDTHICLNIPEGDSGFNVIYQDSSVWPTSGNQVGHYLTAVDISIGVHAYFKRTIEKRCLSAWIRNYYWTRNVGDSVRPSSYNAGVCTCLFGQAFTRGDIGKGRTT